MSAGTPTPPSPTPATPPASTPPQGGLSAILSHPFIQELYTKFGVPGVLVGIAGVYFAPKHFEFMDSVKETNVVQARAVQKIGDVEEGQSKILESIGNKIDNTRDLVKDIHRAVHGPTRAEVKSQDEDTIQ